MVNEKRVTQFLVMSPSFFFLTVVVATIEFEGVTDFDLIPLTL